LTPNSFIRRGLLRAFQQAYGCNNAMLSGVKTTILAQNCPCFVKTVWALGVRKRNVVTPHARACCKARHTHGVAGQPLVEAVVGISVGRTLFVVA